MLKITKPVVQQVQLWTKDSNENLRDQSIRALIGIYFLMILIVAVIINH